MHLAERRIKLERGIKTVEILFSGCLHVGHAGTQEQSILDMVDYIAEKPNRRLVLLGDVTDGISVSDPRFNPREVAPWLATEDLSNRIMLEAERAVSMLHPIRDKIDGLVEGNHERKPRTVAQVDLHRVLAKGLGVQSLGVSAFLKYKFVGRDRGEANPVVFYCEHGAGGAGSVGVVINKLVKRAKDFPGADAYVGAHHHKNGASTAETMSYNEQGGSITRKDPLVVTVGTFMSYFEKGRETYGEVYGMPVPSIGPAKITVQPWGKIGARVGYSFPYWT